MTRAIGVSLTTARKPAALRTAARDLRGRGSTAVALSTMAIALLGWLVFVVAGHQLGPAGYARFSVLWGFAFAIAGVLSGLQQETTRAVSMTDEVAAPDDRGHRAGTAAAVVGIGAAALVAATSPAWAPSVMGGWNGWGVAAICLGIASLGAFLVMRAVLAAAGAWTPFSWLGTADALVRCLVVSTVCIWTASTAGLMWGIVSGWFVWLAFLAWPVAAATVRTRQPLRLGASLRRSASAMVATGCTAVLVAGFPFLARVTASHDLGPSAGVLFAAVLATRTPLTLPLNGYQLMILRYLVSRRSSMARALLPLLAGVAAVTVFGVGLAALVGPAVLRLFFGSGFDASAGLLVALVAAAGVLAGMTLTGFAALAADRHLIYTAGWVVATTLTIALLLIPMSLTDRSVLSLLAAPIAGAAVHALALR